MSPEKIIPYSEIHYESPRPPVVVRGTAAAMDLYFQNQLRDLGPFRGFLSSDTLDLIFRTELGFARNIKIIDRLGLLPQEDLEQIVDAAQPFLKDSQEENEAFGVALVAFSFMPELARHRELSQGFSRRGMLAPPVTTGDFTERISELKSEVVKIVSGETKPDNIKTKLDQPLWRTYLFFQVGSVIPLRMPKSPSEAKEAINEMLQGIDIDL